MGASTVKSNKSGNEESSREHIRPVVAEIKKDPPLPPQGPGRPGLPKAASAPDLGHQLRTQHLGETSTAPNQVTVHADHDNYRQGLDKLLRGLAAQTKKRTDA